VSAPTERPEPLSVKPEGIPDELKSWPQWVVWRYEWKADEQKWTKPPRQVRGGGLAKSNDRRT
jgi:primase-polymerase (primpol)-like protein